MNDVMLDLETLSAGSEAVIVQIGACYFDRYTGDIRDKFLVNVDFVSEKIGEFEGSTIQWWLNQAKEGNPLTFLNNPVRCYEALMQFKAFVKDAKQIWSHATFDFVIMQEALKRFKIKPLPYRTARDIRTLVDLAGLPKQDTSVKTHDALEDCIFQVKYCVECFNALQGKVI